MDKLHWILLIIALGAVALVIMLGLIVTKEKEGNYKPAFKKLADDYRNGEYDVMKPLRSDFDSKEVVDNTIKDAGKVSNMFDRFQYDIDKVKFKHMSNVKPKIKKEYSFIEFDRGTYKSTPYYQCSVGRFGIIGSGLTPKQAYENWLKAVIQ